MKTFKSLLAGSIVLIWTVLIIAVAGNNEARAEDPFSISAYLNDSIFNSEHIASSGDMPQYILEKTALYLKSFTTSKRDLFQKWLDQSIPHMLLIKKILREEGLPEDLAFLPLIESGFNVNARSSAKATGMWQFMATTGAHYGLEVNSWIDERRDPVKSTRAAARHLKDLYETFGSWPLALASYNAGSGKIKRVLDDSSSSTFWEIGQSKALAAETRNYIPKFMAAMIIARNPESFGFTFMEVPAFQYDFLEVPAGMDVSTITERSGISTDLVRSINPELRGNTTPMSEPTYILRLPRGIGTVFLDNFDGLLPAERVVYNEYKIRKGDSVYYIAKKFQTTVSAIRDANKLKKRSRIIAGKTLLVPVRLSYSSNIARLVTPSNISPDITL
ncbi:MAG: transglycosylase SLT domain-containing protein [Nitrospirae bacterium]|nr:transglycosylase SLT domain-containing protein [Nitrospirota bacterium]